MRHAMIIAVLLAGCGQQGAPEGPVANSDVPSQSGPWDLATSDDGAELAFAGASDEPLMRLFCPAGDDRLVVNVAEFEPVGSEERMTFGQGATVVTLVADPSGDELRGGVTAEGPVPANLAQLLSGPVAANYGSQNSGPHSPPPATLVNAFAGACSGTAGSADGGAASSENASQNPDEGDSASSGGSACLTGRDGEPVPANRIRAVGTEPFWAAQVEGRCVTYSHPENQSGTRVWTQFSGTAESGSWSGHLNGQRFVMRTRPQPGCSDGMSDKRYPIAVTLTVGGEQRRGCAERR